MNATPRPKYVHTILDRHGHRRFYFGREGYPRATLPAPDDPGFAAAYTAALATEPEGKNRPQNITRNITAPPERAPDSFSDLCRRFYQSARYVALGPVTQATYRNIIERLRREHGDKPFRDLDRRGVRAILGKLADRPEAANQALRMLRMLMSLAVEDEDRPDNPCLGIKKLKSKGDGFKPWGEDHIAAFERRHPEGSKARLALALLLYSAQRRGDVVRLGPGNLKRGRLCLTQRKTGAYLEIPVHPRLADLLPAGDLPAYLLTEYGRPFSPAGFGGWFGDRCREAGLGSGFNAHGLRKAACRRLAEAGCTAHEIMSMSGHKTLAEVERYTKAASQTAMAGEAMRKLDPGSGFQVETLDPPPLTPWAETIVALPREVRAANDNKGFEAADLKPLPVAPR